MTDLFFSVVFYRRTFPAERRFLSDKIQLCDVVPDRPLYVAAGQALSVHEYAVNSHSFDPVSFRVAADIDLGSRHPGVGINGDVPEQDIGRLSGDPVL